MGFLCALLVSAHADRPRGQPFIRTYPLDEIGSVPRALWLGFDAFGRVAVMYDGTYAVLNDTVWVSRVDPAAAAKVRMSTIRVADGKYYYGGRGTWGTVELTPDGLFRAAPLVPENAPEWTRVTPFNKLLVTPTGLYFYEFNGVVHWDFVRRKNTFFTLSRISAVFSVGDRVFASGQDQQLRELLPASGGIRPVQGTGIDGEVVEFAAPLDRSHTLLALRRGQLVVFDGQTASAWRPQAEHHVSGRITAMERLVEGGVAIAVADTGIYIFSPDGTLRWSLFDPDLQGVGSLAAGEPGVLWVAGENAVHRIFYDSPLTSFGRQLGLAAVWPQVADWNGRTVGCSNGTLHEMAPSQPGHPHSFRILGSHARRPIDHIATSGPHLLTGDATGVQSVDPDGTPTPVIPIDNVAGLAFITPDTCLVIGCDEIAALRHADGRWSECAPRIAGVGDAPIHLEKHRRGSLWIEMGGDRVARLALRDGRLHLQKIKPPWQGEQWTNVGMTGDTIVLSGAPGQRAFHDEATGEPRAAPELDRLLNRSPYWLSRVKQDESGTLWATHPQGVVTFTPQAGDHLVDPTTFELRNDSYPSVIILPDDNVWIATSRSLYHVERPTTPTRKTPHAVLVSVMADRHNLELLDQTGRPALAPQFSFDDNSLSFRFFSGTYAWRSPPAYEYRFGPLESWTPVDPGLVLRFPKLRDGSYRLEMRQAGPHAADSPSFVFAFVINPPWYRTRSSYAAYSLVLILSLVGVARWMNHRSLQRNTALERQMRERTRELEIAMDKLGEETRNAATFAERSRLAGEMHDSLQQGLSGSLLHLETTMNHPSVTPEVQAQLNVVRKMLSFSREEVQQSVWNLESPLLHNSTLGEALRTIAGYIGGAATEIRVMAHAEPAALDPAIRHHLLRIAQEALTNAVKHAEASHIGMTLQSQPEAVILRVTDNGKGFDAAAGSPVDGHFGLRGLRSRARSINARLRIISTPGAGTTVEVTAPLNENPSDDPNRQKQPA